MDHKLLMDLFHIPAPSGKEKKISDFIASYLKSINIPFSFDTAGNIYNISNNNKPLLSAHMDTVQDDNDCFMSKFIYINKEYNIIKGYGVIGADDKCGIYIILDLLKNGHTDLNFLFSVEEETGGSGGAHFVKNNDLEHILYGLVLDRRGGGDIICHNNEYGIKNFQDVLSKIGEHFGYKPSTGTFSDADALSTKISCANLSVGYYNAHSKNEYVKLSELQNAINFTHSIVKNLDVKFEAPVKSKSGWYSGWLNGYDDGDYYYDYNDYQYVNDLCDLCGHNSSKIVYMHTIGANLCNFCIEDIRREIDNIEFSKSIDERYGGM